MSTKGDKKARGISHKAIISLAVVAIFIISMGFLYVSQMAKPVRKGLASVAREEVYWINLKGINHNTTDSRYLLNYAVIMYNSSDSLVITDKVEPNLPWIELEPEYDNVETKYDAAKGEIKIKMKDLTAGSNYMIQVAFSSEPKSVFDDAIPIVTCTPRIGLGYEGLVELNMTSFKLNDVDKIDDATIYFWFTELAYDRKIVSSKPPATSIEPAYEAIWYYEKPIADFEARSTIYDIKVLKEAGGGDILFRTWVDIKYLKSIKLTNTPTFEGATVYYDSGGSGYSLQYEYTISGK